MVAFTSGSMPMLPDDPTPTNRAPVLASTTNGRFACPRTMPNTPFLVINSWPLRWGEGLRQLVRADPERPANLLVLGADARARRNLVFGTALSLRAQRQCCEADAANRNDCEGDAGRHYTLSVVARRPPVSSALGNNPAR